MCFVDVCKARLRLGDSEIYLHDLISNAEDTLKIKDIKCHEDEFGRYYPGDYTVDYLGVSLCTLSKHLSPSNRTLQFRIH